MGTRTWSKADTEAAWTAAEGAVLYRYGPGTGAQRRAEVLASLPDEDVAEMAAAHLSGLAQGYEERARHLQDVADHLAANPNVYGNGTPERVARCRRDAQDDAECGRATRALMARLRAGGMPPRSRISR